MSIPDVVDSLPDFVDRDVTSMLPVETRPNIAETLYTSVFPTMILPRYLFFRVVNKNRGLHSWLRIFGILRIM